MQHDQSALFKQKACYATGTQMKNCWCSTIRNIAKIKFCYDAIQLCGTSTTFSLLLHLSLYITMQNFGGRYCIRLILDGTAIPRSESVLLVFCNTTITSFGISYKNIIWDVRGQCHFKNWILIFLYKSRDHFVQPRQIRWQEICSSDCLYQALYHLQKFIRTEQHIVK